MPSPTAAFDVMYKPVLRVAAPRNHRTVIGIGVLLVLLVGCRPGSSPSRVPSGDGRFVLVTLVEPQGRGGVPSVTIRVLDKAGRVVWENKTHAADHSRWSVHWEDNLGILLESSDIGSRRWKFDAESSTWKEIALPFHG